MRVLPVFSERFSMTPETFWSLTNDEFTAYMKHIETQANQEADQQMMG